MVERKENFDDAWLTEKEIPGTRSLSDKIASRLDFTTANQISSARIILSIPVAFLYAFDFVLLGSLVFTVSCLCDWFDGAVARYQTAKYKNPPLTNEEEKKLSFSDVMLYKGETYTGKVLDPLGDKISYFCALIPLGYNYLSDWLLFGSLIMAFLLSVVRPIQYFFHLGESASNWFGKRKIWVEIGVIGTLVFFPNGEWTQIVSNSVLGVAFVFSVLSFIGHMYIAWKNGRLSTT